jgi:hypothetical protein
LSHPYVQQITDWRSCFNVADLHDQENAESSFFLKVKRDSAMKPSIFHGSSPMFRIEPSAIQIYLESRILDLEGIELELFVDKLTSSTCEPNTFDPTNFYSAYQLLRLLAEANSLTKMMRILR